MDTKLVCSLLGVCLFLLGGALLAFSGTALGTSIALAGIVLVAWTWWQPRHG